jgi:hypothetical protein
VHLTLAFSDLRIDPKYRDCTTGDSLESRTQEQSERELPGGRDFCREDRRTGSQRLQLDKWGLPRLSIEMVLSKSNEAPRSELILATYLGHQRQVFVVGVVGRNGWESTAAKIGFFFFFPRLRGIIPRNGRMYADRSFCSREGRFVYQQQYAFKQPKGVLWHSFRSM